MTELSYEYPEKAELRSASDTKIRTALVKIKEAVNGKLTNENLEAGTALANLASASVTDAKLASPNNSAYRLVFQSQSVCRLDLAAGTYALDGVNALKSGNNLSSAALAFFYFDDADYTVAGKTQKLRLRAQIAVNETKAAIKFTFGLYPITVAGGADECKVTLGTVVSGSTVEINEPAASTVTSAAGSDFTIPSDGAFALGVVTSGTLTNNSDTRLSAQVQTRSV